MARDSNSATFTRRLSASSLAELAELAALTALTAFAASFALGCEGGPGTPDFPPTGPRDPVGDPIEKAPSVREVPTASSPGKRPETPLPDPSPVEDDPGTKAGCAPCDKRFKCVVAVAGGKPADSEATLVTRDGKCFEASGYEFACDASIRSPSGASIGSWSPSATGFSFCVNAATSYCGECSVR